MPAFLRFGLAAVSGWLVYLSYEPIGRWWAAVLGIALLWLTLMPWPRRATAALGMAGEAQARPSARFGALIGFTHGLFCYLFLLPWVGEFVGAMPYIALAITMALYALATGAFGVLVARWRYGAFTFPLVYLAVEFVRSSPRRGARVPRCGSRDAWPSSQPSCAWCRGRCGGTCRGSR